MNTITVSLCLYMCFDYSVKVLINIEILIEMKPFHNAILRHILS